MLRVLLALTFFFLFNLYACEGGYHSCVNKVKHSKSIKNNTLQIPISKYKRLVFSRTKPSGKILKHDPYLSLYIVQDKKGFKYPFKINMKVPSGIGMLTNTSAREIKIIKDQVGLNQFGIINTPLKSPAILTNSCCSLEAIVTKRGVIAKDYIKRFIDKKDICYGDIGMRVKDTPKGVVVVSFNPFMKKNPFLKNDYILAMDGKNVKYSSNLMRKILFSTIGTIHTVKVRRDGKIKRIKVRTQKRLSGGYKIETYLKKYGLTFDKNLYITKIDTSKKFYGLVLGDQLLIVNTHVVQNHEDVMKYISDFKFHPTLLFERNANFQFFVTLD